MTQLFTSFDKRLDAGQVTRVEPDRRLPGNRTDGAEELLDPVRETVRLVSNRPSGAFAGKLENRPVDMG